MMHPSFKKLCLLISVGLIVAIAYLYSRPLPQIYPTAQLPAPTKAKAIELPWPATGQAALGAQGYGVLATHNTNDPVSIASVAKVIAALAILQQKPLAVGEQGPNITLDNQDLDYYNYYYLNNGSVAKVEVGEQISEYQALQAMLLPSANNFADSLTRWAFGSQTAYAAYANKMLKDMGLSKTTINGASGFADDAKSTADELVKIGLAALKNPVISQVTGQASASMPVAGEVKNTNWLLGSDNVVGIKTGHTDGAGGCYLFASKRLVEGQNVIVVGAVLGAADLTTAISSAPPILDTADTGFSVITPIHKGQVVATYKAPWNATASAVASKDVSLLEWKGNEVNFVKGFVPVTAPANTGSSVGKITIKSGSLSASSSAVLNQELPAPPWTWRLFH